MPWLIFDYKGEELIERLEDENRSVREIKPGAKLPKHPGISIVRPLPDKDDDAVEAMLQACWAKREIGIFIDEGYMIPPSSSALKAILTQGRSRRVPVIALYQRPVYMSRFAVAQADFFAAFEQNDERDLKVTSQFVKPAITPNGGKVTAFDPLPEYHCLWYDVGRGKTHVLGPAPGADEIASVFKRRLHSIKKGSFI